MAVLEGIVVMKREIKNFHDKYRDKILDKKKIFRQIKVRKNHLEKKGSLGSEKSEKKPYKERNKGTFWKKNATTDHSDWGQGNCEVSFLHLNDPKRHRFRLLDKNKQILFF